jgi:hypothetical protein
MVKRKRKPGRIGAPQGHNNEQRRQVAVIAKVTEAFADDPSPASTTTKPTRRATLTSTRRVAEHITWARQQFAPTPGITQSSQRISGMQLQVSAPANGGKGRITNGMDGAKTLQFSECDEDGAADADDESPDDATDSSRQPAGKGGRPQS